MINLLRCFLGNNQHKNVIIFIFPATIGKAFRSDSDGTIDLMKCIEEHTSADD